MNWFEKLLCFLQSEMIEPTPFGWFHCMWICFVVIAIFGLYSKEGKYSERKLKIVLGTYGFIALILEILKQLIWSFNYDPVIGISSWSYQWYSFPFQLCTTPIFVSLICLFLKKGKIRTSLLSYLSYVTILGSISTVLLPESCFVSDILVNIHTMWLHLGSLAVSIYLVMSGEVKINLVSIKYAIYIFLIFVFVAEIMNIAVYNLGVLGDQTFNMFYISPYFTSTLPIFDMIQERMPYIIFLLVYIIAVIIGSFIMYGCFSLVACLFKKKNIRE